MDNDERITTTFIGREFGWDRMSDVNWPILLTNVMSARRILDNPEKFPRANFDHCEKMDQEGTNFLMRGPIEYFMQTLHSDGHIYV